MSTHVALCLMLVSFIFIDYNQGLPFQCWQGSTHPNNTHYPPRIVNCTQQYPQCHSKWVQHGNYLKLYCSNISNCQSCYYKDYDSPFNYGDWFGLTGLSYYNNSNVTLDWNHNDTTKHHKTGFSQFKSSRCCDTSLCNAVPDDPSLTPIHRTHFSRNLSHTNDCGNIDGDGWGMQVTEIPPIFNNTCQCSLTDEPLYDTFPHPLHTDDSYAVFNFYNDGGYGPHANTTNVTVWITVTVNANARMALFGFDLAYDYVYVDAQPVLPQQLFSYTIKKDTTAGGFLSGGRIYVYYEDPHIHDMLRTAFYPAGMPVQMSGNLMRIQSPGGLPWSPSNNYAQLLEFTLDVLNNDPDNQSFIDYDLSGVDSLTLPVYIYGGYDPRNTENGGGGSPCGKAYIACSNIEDTLSGCPTQIVDQTAVGGRCQSSFLYCESTGYNIVNQTHWDEYCHKLDEIANGFNITQLLLDYYRSCVEHPDDIHVPQCPSTTPLLVSTPTNVIYGCVGKFLLENHCLLDGSRDIYSRLDGPQCSAINRGLCFTPDYEYYPPNHGLSCAKRPISCSGEPGATCFIPCITGSCLGFRCEDFEPGNYSTECLGSTCDTRPNNMTECTTHIDVIEKTKTSTCNDSTPDPYSYGLHQNDYSAWVRSHGRRLYGFSLDEEAGGGNQQCRFSTQLDIVIFPKCNGTYSPPYELSR